MPIPTIRPATHADLPALHPVIERAYRGDAARLGWSHEADLVEGDRTSIETLASIVYDPEQRLLIALERDHVLGCVVAANKGDGLAYLGLLCVDPVLQSGGIGRRLALAAEHIARLDFGATAMEMTVIDSRAELIAWYERLGYRRTAEVRDFPVPMDPPLFMTVLVKSLA